MFLNNGAFYRIMTEASTDIDTYQLELYLTEALDTDVIRTEVLSDKVNLVIGISTKEEENAYVLRRPNALRHASLFNDLKQEYRLLQTLQQTVLPTQTPMLFCDDRSVLGDSVSFVNSF